MKKTVKPLPNRTQDILKGALAGLVGGLIATAAKTAAERIYPPHSHGEPNPPASQGIRWGMGAATGAAYGAIAELYPEVTAKGGTTFGLALLTVSNHGVLPAMGLATVPEPEEGREHRSEMATHVVYGIVCETVRNLVRRVI
jgi:putative membrane protein